MLHLNGIITVLSLITLFFSIYLLAFRFKVNKSVTVTVVVSSLYIYIVLGFIFFLTFLIAFVLIGISKLIILYFTKETDIKHYRVANFAYSSWPLILVSTTILFLADSSFSYFSVFCGLSTVISDTASNEFGKAFGKKTWLITNLKPVTAGTDGGISIVGTLFGILFSILFSASIFFIYNLSTFQKSIFISLLGVIGNIIDSYLGATLQNKGVLNNEQVNMVSIVIVILLSWVFYLNI